MWRSIVTQLPSPAIYTFPHPMDFDLSLAYHLTVLLAHPIGSGFTCLLPLQPTGMLLYLSLCSFCIILCLYNLFWAAEVWTARFGDHTFLMCHAVPGGPSQWLGHLSIWLVLTGCHSPPTFSRASYPNIHAHSRWPFLHLSWELRPHVPLQHLCPSPGASPGSFLPDPFLLPLPSLLSDPPLFQLWIPSSPPIPSKIVSELSSINTKMSPTVLPTP